MAKKVQPVSVLAPSESEDKSGALLGWLWRWAAASILGERAPDEDPVDRRDDRNFSNPTSCAILSQFEISPCLTSF